jgi:hypothetical protein
VEALPETYQILLHVGDSLFEYIVSKQPDKVLIHVRVVFHKTFYKPEIYNELREFMADVSKTINQQVVFRKGN